MKPFQKFIPSALLKLGVAAFLLAASAVATANFYLVTWEPSPESDLAGYKVYYGNSRRVYSYCVNVGMAEKCIIAIQDTGVFCVAVTAFDIMGNESDYSQEFMIDFRVNIPPLEQFQLLPNYPNPFNPVTVIPFSLNHPTRIELAIFDILGRRVRILEWGEKPAGVHQVFWRGDDESGHTVANGVYICRLAIGNFYKTTKVMLVR